MSTASEEILARYKQTVSKVDKFGRTITLGLLRPARELAVLRMIGTDERTNQLTYLAVASVRKIDEIDMASATTLGELDSIINKLDSEGLAAVGEAYAEVKGAGKPKTDEEAVDALKN